MEFTNDQELPDELHQFLQYSDYNSSGARFDISCTKLIDSPQIAQFWKAHGMAVVEDSSSRLYSSMGSGIHSRFEAANASNPDVMCEKRYSGQFPHPIEGNDPLTLSAQIDSYNFKTKTLADLKTVSAWKILFKDYESFEKQLNICAYLMGQAGHKVEKLQIYALVRDWSRMRVTDKDYPKQPIQVIDIPMWTEYEQERFILEKLEVHYGEGEKGCTDKERWAKTRQFKVKEKGKKRALRVLQSQAKAESWIKSQGLEDKKSIFIDEIPAVYTRCESFCPFGKMGVCEQYNEDKA